MARPPPQDRRQYRRVRAPILVRPVGPLVRANPRELIDISVGGLRAYADERYAAGSRLELELFFPDGRSATLLAEVVWVEPLAAGAPARFDVGLRFIDADPDDVERIAKLATED